MKFLTRLLKGGLNHLLGRPVLAPVCITAMMILWGTLVTQIEREGHPACSNYEALLVSLLGAVLASYGFMEDSIPVVAHGEQALRDLPPTGSTGRYLRGCAFDGRVGVAGYLSVTFRCRAAALGEARTI